MGKDAKAGGGKGKGKQSGGSDEASSKGKGKAGKAAADGLGTCTYVKGMCCAKSKERSTRRIKGCRLAGGWLSNGDKVPPAEFAKERWKVHSKMSPSTHPLVSLVHLLNLRMITNILSLLSSVSFLVHALFAGPTDTWWPTIGSGGRKEEAGGEVKRSERVD
ncbi:hypothetical protein YC2023_016774 [Brassica napus]